jgi:hypothetical protein
MKSRIELHRKSSIRLLLISIANISNLSSLVGFGPKAQHLGGPKIHNQYADSASEDEKTKLKAELEVAEVQLKRTKSITDKNFKSFFKPGRVFKVLWTDPNGNDKM